MHLEQQSLDLTSFYLISKSFIITSFYVLILWVFLHNPLLLSNLLLLILSVFDWYFFSVRNNNKRLMLLCDCFAIASLCTRINLILSNLYGIWLLVKQMLHICFKNHALSNSHMDSGHAGLLSIASCCMSIRTFRTILHLLPRVVENKNLKVQYCSWGFFNVLTSNRLLFLTLNCP